MAMMINSGNWDGIKDVIESNQLRNTDDEVVDSDQVVKELKNNQSWFIDLSLKMKGLVETHESGAYWKKELIRRLLLAYTNYYLHPVTEFENKTEGLEVAIYMIRLKDLLKLNSSVVHGKVGGGSFIESDGTDLPVHKSGGKNLYYKTTYWNNDKDTLRWSSARHTVPSKSDYNLSFTPRDKDSVMIHMDLASAEARLAFAVSKEEPMIQAILEGLDIHSFNANNAFSLGYSKEDL